MLPVCLLQLQRAGVLRAAPGAEAGRGSDPERLLQPLRTSPVPRPGPYAAEPRQVRPVDFSKHLE